MQYASLNYSLSVIATRNVTNVYSCDQAENHPLQSMKFSPKLGFLSRKSHIVECL